MKAEKEQGENTNEMTSFIIENQERFYRLAYSYVKNQETALDIVQSAIVKALEHSHELRQKAYMKTWFYRILVNESLTYLKKAGREVLWEPEQMKNVMEKEGAEPETSQEVFDAVMQLPDEMKTVLILRYYEDLTLADIAEVTGESLSKVKYRLYTGLEKLRKNWSEEVAR